MGPPSARCQRIAGAVSREYRRHVGDISQLADLSSPAGFGLE